MSTLLNGLRRSAAGAVLALGCALPAAADPIYLSFSVDLQQTAGPVIVASPNAGYNLWSTTFLVTNISGAAVSDARFWYLGPLLNTGAGLANAQWNNATQTFSTPDATLTSVNNTGYALLGDSDLGDFPAFGVDGSDSMAYWALGDLAAGASVSVTLVRELTANVIELRSAAVGFTHTVAAIPEPGALALSLAALVAAGSSARRRRARQA